MASCTYGASVKSGLNPDQQILVDRSLYEQVTGTPPSWFDWFLDIFSFDKIKLSDLCALNLDDPAVPTAEQLAAAFTLDHNAYQLVHDYILGKLRFNAFSTYCSCNAAPGATPSGCVNFLMGSTGWGAVTAGSSYYLGNRFHTGTSIQHLSGWAWLQGSGETEPHEFRLYDSSHNLLNTWTLTHTSTNVTWLIYTIPTTVQLAANTQYVLTAKLSVGNSFQRNGLVSTGNAGRDVNYQEFLDTVTNTWGTSTGNQSAVDPTMCNTGNAPYSPPAPTVPTQPPTLTVPSPSPCSTTADLCTRIAQLGQKLDWLRQDVTLLQRQSVPFAFITGTAHSVSGSGEFSVQAIPAVSVAVSNIPSYVGSSPTYPATRYKIGTVSFGITSGFKHRQDLVHASQVVEVPPWATRIGYEFPSPMTATITELRREP